MTLPSAMKRLPLVTADFLPPQRQMSEQKAKYDEYLLGMYKKGQEAARFEREQEVRFVPLFYFLINNK